MARKEARIREDQFIALSRLVRVLLRRRSYRSGPRITENTLIRIAIDLLLTRAHRLIGNTEPELRASVLPSGPRDPVEQADYSRVVAGGQADTLETVDDDGLGAPNCPDCLIPMEPVGRDKTLRWQCSECGTSRIA